MTEIARHRPMLVLGGIGKTGRRLVQRLTHRDIPVRVGSRSSGLPFHWEQPSTWAPVFQDVDAAFAYLPDLVVANPVDAIAGVVETAVLDGHNAEATDGVEHILGRPPRDFVDYARVTAATGVWDPTVRPSFSEAVR